MTLFSYFIIENSLELININSITTIYNHLNKKNIKSKDLAEILGREEIYIYF